LDAGSMQWVGGEQGIAQPAPRGQGTALIRVSEIWKELEKMKKMSPI
jgi:hypothetical protein